MLACILEGIVANDAITDEQLERAAIAEELLRPEPDLTAFKQALFDETPDAKMGGGGGV